LSVWPELKGINMICNLRLGATLIPAAFWVFSQSTLAAPQAGGAEIVSIQGKGEVRATPSASWSEAVTRQQLTQGAAVRTLDSSRMAVLLADQTQSRLAPNSMLEIKQVGDGAARATQLKQDSGRTWTQSKNVPDKLTVQTPTALAAIRGTDWELVVDEDGTSTLTVLSGEVLLSNEQGSINIATGEQGRVQKGVAPVKTILLNPRERVQWVSSFTVDIRRYPDLTSNAAIRALFADNDLAGARHAAAQLTAQADAPASATLLLSDFSVQEGQLDHALAILQQGSSRYPADERFEVWRARLYLLRDDMAGARAALAGARIRNSRSTELMLAEGELERMEGNASAATAAYQSAIALTPESGRAWHGLGVVQSEREDAARARISLNRALVLEPQGTGFLAELGTLEAFADRLDVANTAFTQALQERPDDYVALTGLALVDLKKGKSDEAMRQLLAASLIEPRYARAQTYLAVAYYQQGRTRDALFALSRARALDPKDPLPDLYQSIIHNDMLQPGDALITARKALALLPYLKSLNQIANDQKGGANLGSALAAFGLEDWARSYAQDSFTPFWAGSHLFLADRYSGDFNKKSELFQGFLSDPTVFGASNRFSTLIAKPGHYGNLGLRYNSSADFKLSEPTVNVNGYSSAGMPVAYFAEIIRTQARPDQAAFDATAKTYTVALGARPSHELGLFVYANAFDADLTLSPSNGVVQHVKGSNDRLDIGAHYRFAPQSQVWLKLGRGTESSTVGQTTSAQTNMGLASNGSDFETRPHQRDLQWRHTFAVSDSHELSWGIEDARMDKTNTLVQENFYHLGEGVVPSDRLILDDRDHSRDLWLSNRIRASARLNLQADLAWQHYSKTRGIDIYRDRQPPVTQQLAEDYDQGIVAPRLGASYTLGSGATLRGAWQKWLHPASYSALSPVATAGIPVDDSLVNPGGVLTRTRAQLDWELSPTWFLSAFADHKRANNLYSPLDGVLNTRADVSNIDRVRQRTVANLGAPDQVEATPVFSSGTANVFGATVNQVLSRTLAGYLGYANTQSENTGIKYVGKFIPYLPQHRATVGLTWVGEQRLLLSAQAVWRSARFADEANLVPLPSGWDMTLRLHWESSDKRWAVDGYAVNLLKPNVERLLGLNLVGRY
jgi:Flp pilus assembly protein TadD